MNHLQQVRLGQELLHDVHPGVEGEEVQLQGGAAGAQVQVHLGQVQVKVVVEKEVEVEV